MATTSRRREGSKLRLTVFLIKQDRLTIEDFLDTNQLRSVRVGSSGFLFFKTGFITQASWASIFAEVSGFNPAAIVNSHSRGLYVIREGGRWFCFTFGYTRHLLKDSAIERNFGLIVSLNLGDPGSIKAIDKTNISHVGLQSREQAGRDVGFDAFEFDTDIDLLKSITAKAPPREGEEQETYSGRDSFSVYTSVALDTFPAVAKRLYRAFQNTAYRERYPWVDKITEERDPAIVASLNERLVHAINVDELTRIWMAIPEIVEWEEVDSFTYKLPSGAAKMAGPACYPDIDLDSWLRDTKLRGRLTLNHLTGRKIYQCYKDDREPTGWSIYRCLNAEVDIGNAKYILNDGDWYNVEGNYAKSVDAFYQSVPLSNLTLPNYRGLTEPKYLTTIPKAHPQYALMDCKTVMIGGGRSRIEFCDLYSTTKDIIHVKQYGGSSLLSHLFSQAMVSATCFLYEPAFRAEVNKLLPHSFKLADPTVGPKASEYTVCIAIMSKVPGALELPFFSKVTFNHAVRAIQRMSFKVTRLKIDR